jgi:hypothetical protein
VGPISPPAVSPLTREVIGGAPEWCAFGCWVTPRRSSSRVACCSALFLGVDRKVALTCDTSALAALINK